MAMYRPSSAIPVQGRQREATRGAAYQQEQHQKYSTVIKAFLSGVTADILRMRLQQVANAQCMSVKNFLDVHKVNILMALADLQSLILIAYPPKHAVPDLARWSTRLLCIVLRASNCLSVREQDDVIFLAKMYQQHFRRSSQKCVGLIAKRGTQAKREWFKVCAAVQRLVDKADATELMSQVRNFICKVEMETKTTQTRKETQTRLEDLISEMIEDGHPGERKPTKEHISDEAKGIIKKQLADLKYSSRPNPLRPTRRPKSALPRLSTIREYDEVQRSKNSARSSCSPGRPRSATAKISSAKLNDPPLFMTILKESKRQQTEREVNKTKRSAWNANTKPKPFQPGSQKVTPKKDNLERKLGVIKRRYSVGDLSDSRKRTVAKKRSFRNKSRPQSTRSMRSVVSVDTKQKSRKSLEKPRGSRRSKSLNAILDKSPSTHELAAENRSNPDSWMKNLPLKNGKSSNPNTGNEMTKNNAPEPKLAYAWRSEKAQRDHSADKPIPSNGDTNQNKCRDNPLSNSTSSTKYLDAVETELSVYNGKEDEHNDAKRFSKPFNDFQKIDNYSDSEDIPNTPFENLEWVMKESSDTNDISKEYDENMKKIANEVIVHQQMHLAVRNPLFQDKRFVDEFFKFLEANNVTKTFLRSQATDPQKSWKLHNGKRVQFSFFLAYIFRHVENRESDQALYLVQKMLKRMQCKHKNLNRPNSSTIANGNGMDKMSSVPISSSSLNNNNSVSSSGPIASNGTDNAMPGAKRNPKGRKNSPLTRGTRPIARLRERLSRHQSRSKSSSRESLTRVTARRPHSASINRSVSSSLASLVKRHGRNRSVSPKSRSEERKVSVGGKLTSESNANRRSRSKSPKAKKGEIRKSAQSAINGATVPGSFKSKTSTPSSELRSKSPRPDRGSQLPDSGRRSKSPNSGRRSKSPNSGRRSKSPNRSSNMQDTTWQRSTSIGDGKCWKCEHKEAAMTICVNWGNMKLCELLLTYGVQYREEHLVAAVKANDLLTLKHIVRYLKDNLYWNPRHQEVKEALFVARKHRMRKIVAFLEAEGVQDTRAIAANACTSCLIN